MPFLFGSTHRASSTMNSHSLYVEWRRKAFLIRDSKNHLIFYDWLTLMSYFIPSLFVGVMMVFLLLGHALGHDDK